MLLSHWVADLTNWCRMEEGPAFRQAEILSYTSEEAEAWPRFSSYCAENTSWVSWTGRDLLSCRINGRSYFLLRIAVKSCVFLT